MKQTDYVYIIVHLLELNSDERFLQSQFIPERLALQNISNGIKHIIEKSQV